MTVDAALTPLIVTAALGCGLMSGLFFAFSISVMRALATRPTAEGMAAMQAINTAILNPVFLLLFLATPLACAMTVLLAVLDWGGAAPAFAVAGSVVYLAGGLVVTAAVNMPMNNALDEARPEDPESEGPWRRYLSAWTAWNHLRTISSLAAAALLTIALVV